MGNDNNRDTHRDNDRDTGRDSGLAEEGPESMGPLAGPDPRRASDTNEERDGNGADVREQIRATPSD